MRERAFKVPAAACAEQHIATKQDAGCEVGEMVVEVAGNFENVEINTECIQFDLTAFAQVMADKRIAGMAPPIHRHVVYFAQFRDAAGMVGVAVGTQNRIQLQAACIQERKNRRGLARVDHGGILVMVDRPDVIVL